MRVALVPGPGKSGVLASLADDGTPLSPPVEVPDLAAAVARREADDPVRWVWDCGGRVYPTLLRAGVRVARCHDAALVDGLLTARDGPASRPGTLTAASARRAGLAAPGDPVPSGVREIASQLLFEEPPAASAHELLAELITVHKDQLGRIGADPLASGFGLLATAESAGGLAAAEMTAAGLPWRADVHDELLTELLGPRPAAAPGMPLRPARLAELTAQISAALGAVRPVNPDSPAQLLRALAASGIRVPSTRVSVLRAVDHPVIPLLLRYKELARLHTANGWSWLDTWVAGGRFRPEYVVGGVVSGRWATRGGGALQIPRVLRCAVVADPGWTLVVADAAQLEPRVLAALAGDRAFAQTAAGGDVYAAVASAVGADRDRAKVALLSAMYGGTGGDGGQSLALLRRRFPQASAFVEAAARAGEEGRVVRSVLGRTCPPPSAAWLSVTSESGDPELERDPEAGRASRARGRFTRNFVVQASAADWALVLLAGLRARLAALDVDGQRPELVFFQHDEVIVHCPAGLAAEVVTAVEAAAASATNLVFGATEVSFPMTTAVVTAYSDAK
ncbi:MAG TPA: bifunctional 3'-5' exonuclease/DNA polymerase [Streptosporangiaceae bacterium]|nr:bifunctional 3'-5' exonuclease/DNA polymerase [Streptosporangiaceae bacterium]